MIDLSAKSSIDVREALTRPAKVRVKRRGSGLKALFKIFRSSSSHEWIIVRDAKVGDTFQQRPHHSGIA